MVLVDRMSARTRRIRNGARHAALDVLSARYRGERGSEVLRTPRVHFPYMHSLRPADENKFRDLLEMLARDHEFITYGEAVDRALNGPIDKPYIAWSFDDGFDNNLRAAEILEEFGARACFFIIPDFVDTKLSAEDARLEFGLRGSTFERSMTWEEICDLKDRGHEIGNHTMHHQTLASLSDQELHDEIVGSAETIRRRVGRCDHFAWPRGRSFHISQAAVRVVFGSGHVSCASAERGAHAAPRGGSAVDLCIRRDNATVEWPLRHVRYFLARGSEDATDGAWPEGLG